MPEGEVEQQDACEGVTYDLRVYYCFIGSPLDMTESEALRK